MRSTIQKQTSLIARYCLAAVVLLALLGPLAEIARGDFILWNDDQLTVNSYHNQGTLYDISRAFIVPGGSIGTLNAYDSGAVGVSGGSITSLYGYDSSTVDISGGSVNGLQALNSSTVSISGGSVNGYLWAHDFSDVDISGGSVSSLSASDSSALNISGGSVSSLSALNSSTVSISGGNFGGGYGGGGYLYAYDSSALNISGGSITNLDGRNSSAVDISGGSITNLNAWNSSAVTFYGQNFRVGGELAFDGERVLGTGTLSGEWMDGTRWAVNIKHNDLTATILAIPESAHKPFCVKYPAMDFNGDCKVDFSDLAVFLTHWLDCNLDPPSACWE